MQTNADITLFLCNNGNWITKQIKDVFWDECRSSNIIKSGMQSADSVKIFIPYREELNITPAKDYVVKGIVNYTINTASEQSIAESIKYIRDNYSMYTISVCDKKLYGSRHMQHYMLSCK